MVNDNVYKDSRKYDDIGFEANLRMGVRSKFFKRTFTNMQYRLNVYNYRKLNLENETSHLLDGRIQQQLSDLFNIDLSGGWNLSQMPKAGVYNSDRFYILPSLKWYAFDRTTISGGYIYEKTVYPDYNLDNQTGGVRLKLEQELPLYTYIEISCIIQNKSYPERYLYSGISGSLPTYKTEVRKDAENFIEATVSHSLTARSGFDLVYYFGKLKSNENFFDWGPKQYAEENTTIGDERIIENYRSYTAGKYGINIFTGFVKNSRLSLYASYATMKYAGRLAKDENDNFKQPEVKRGDNQVMVSVSWFIDMFLLRYSYEINNSNDALYNYTNSLLSAGIRYMF